NRIGKLNLAAGTAAGSLKLVENSRCTNVAADDGKVRRRILGRRLLHATLDTLQARCFGSDRDTAIVPSLVAGHRFDTEYAAAVQGELIVHLLETRHFAMDEIVREVDKERLVPNRRPRAEYSVTESERDALPHIQATDTRRNDVAHER